MVGRVKAAGVASANEGKRKAHMIWTWFPNLMVADALNLACLVMWCGDEGRQDSVSQ